MTKEVILDVIEKYSSIYNENDDKQEWFNKIKEVSTMFNPNPGHYHNQGRLECGVGKASTIGEEIRKENVTPKGSPALVNPINNGMDEQEQNGVTVPKRAAMILAQIP